MDDEKQRTEKKGGGWYIVNGLLLGAVGGLCLGGLLSDASGPGADSERLIDAVIGTVGGAVIGTVVGELLSRV